MRAVMIIVMAISLSVPGALAQADSLPTRPRTEVEFLARYGHNDSARALIRYYFSRRKQSSFWVVGAFALIGIGGALASSNDASPGKGLIGIGSADLAGIGLILTSPGFLVVGLSNASRFSTRKLQRGLAQPEQVRPERWAAAIDYQQLITRRRAWQAQRDSLRLAKQQAAKARQKSTTPMTEEEAQRLQEEYWRQRGKVPKRKPKGGG